MFKTITSPVLDHTRIIKYHTLKYVRIVKNIKYAYDTRIITQVGSSGGSSYGRTGRPPPIDQNLGLVMAARLRNGGKFSPKSLTFGHIFV